MLGAIAALAAPQLTYLPNSTVKLEQLIGDFDKAANARTRNLAQERFGIAGTDLGLLFEHRDTHPGSGASLEGQPLPLQATPDRADGERLGVRSFQMRGSLASVMSGEPATKAWISGA